MMKKTIYFLSLLAATAALNACSSNDEVVASGEDGTNDNAYMNVKISLTGNSTRAASDEGYHAGTKDEYTVNSARFLFFDANDNYLTSGKVLSSISQASSGEGTSGQQSAWDANNTNNIESTINATVVLGPTSILTDVKMLTFLNYSQDDFNKLIGKNFDEVLAITTNKTPSSAGSFEMTNSAYVGTDNITTSSGVIQYTAVPKANFKTSATEAIADNNYVTAYVERTVAKVGMVYNSGDNATTKTASEAGSTKPYVTDNSNNNYIYPIQLPGEDAGKLSTFSVDNTDGNLAVKVLGWIPNGYNDSGYLIKHITNKDYSYITSSGTSDWAVEKWNYADNYRSYWAEDANYTTTASASGDEDATRTNLKYYKFSEANGKFDGKYVYENTVDQSKAWYKAGEQNPNVTTMLIVGQVGKWNASKETPFTAVSDYIFRINGAYYTGDHIKSLLASKYYTTASSTGSNQTALTTNDIEFLKSEGTQSQSVAIVLTPVSNGTKKQVIGNVQQFTITLGTSVSLYEKGQSEATTKENVAKYLLAALNASATDTEIECYKQGYCYYQVPIEHPVDKKGTTPTTDGTIYGVVRNHSYKLTLESISNIGDPIYEEDKPIEPIPGKDNYYYVGAKINVLEWRNVKQTVNL